MGKKAYVEFVTEDGEFKFAIPVGQRVPVGCETTGLVPLIKYLPPDHCAEGFWPDECERGGNCVDCPLWR